MHKIDIDMKKLRKGVEVKCPECKDGILKTPYDAKTTCFFKCDKCGMKINWN